jgi:tRNA-specific 2-thiouridylase
MNTSSKTIIVGMSGGVDSSVAALLLKQQGYKVEGLFMKNWEEDDHENYCSAAEDLAIVESVCDKLDIPLHTVNFSKEYWDSVFEDFLKELRQGRTPNPDILCNREIKFKAFLNYALSLGADAIATGHYAKRFSEAEDSLTGDSEHLIDHPIDIALKHQKPSFEKNHQNNYQLLKARDLSKDQSYFLYTLSQKALQHSLFPLADLLKTEVRALAEQAGLPNYQKKDSTGICFIGERPFKTFLSRYFKDEPGAMLTPDNQKVGEHHGLMYYTLGQRQGLGIGGKSDGEEAPWYVVGKDHQQNALIVAQGEHPLLYRQQLEAADCHWIQGLPLTSEFHCQAKIRYRQSDQNCLVRIVPSNNSSKNDDDDDDKNGTAISNNINNCQVFFNEPQRAITPGQSVVFYDNNICLGGGIIL